MYEVKIVNRHKEWEFEEEVADLLNKGWRCIGFSVDKDWYSGMFMRFEIEG